MIDCGNGILLERGVRCVLSDGVTLVSDHYYPSDRSDGPWPTLLMRQPYGRDIASTVVYAHPVWFARHGYHVVIQDVRGRGDSDGDFYPFRNEGRDGAETIAWLRLHTACNGRIGMYGFSYQGLTQLLAAVENPEGLQCIAPHMTAADLYHGWFYHQGALRLASTLGWGIQMLREDARRRGLRAASDRLENVWSNVRAQAAFVPYTKHPAIDDAELPSYVRDWMSHRDADADGAMFWSELDISTRSSRIEIPALHISGWYDTYLEGSIAGYVALRKNAGSQFAREHQYLLAGPWIHIPWGDRAADQNLGAAANFDTDSYLLRWFNHWLKDSDEFTHEPRIRHFALGENEWKSAQEWPEAATTNLYLHSAGNANSRKGDGRLSFVSPEDEEPRDIFVYDPEVPVMAPGGPQSLSGPFDQAVLEMGNNLLVYNSAPVHDAVHIFGRPSVTIYAVTSAASADITAKLVRVTASGRAEFICIGVARSSWLFRDEGYVADQVQCWLFTLEPTSVVIAPGESLRVEIASSAFPLYDRNPSSAAAPQLADHWNWQRSTQQILHTKEHPSALHLPVAGGAAW
ncbi:CocE/NonD family hydrolase [Acidicapsa ligni]|uniref:CocE/NonD family hydrolase n=1 Tax=Acidicapsa ligni TaxID=542300 RepID=UPI0021E008E5|nr:CocE/NonD family hydrolase [Acidicapsa ligni]